MRGVYLETPPQTVSEVVLKEEAHSAGGERGTGVKDKICKFLRVDLHVAFFRGWCFSFESCFGCQ